MADSTIVDSLVAYYVNLLIIQYHNKTKAQATIDAVIRECVANGIAFDIRDGFNIDTAVGVQLDIIGKYVGVDRFYNSYDITGVRFGYSDRYSTEPTDVTGYADSADFLTKEGDILSVADLVGTGYSLSDADFRTIIKLKILVNNSNYSDGQIDSDIESIFGSSLYMVDNLDMSLEYFTTPELSLIVRVALDKELLPKPMGVRINHIIEDNIYFGYTNNASFEAPLVTGYASSGDFLTKDGQILGTDNFI